MLFIFSTPVLIRHMCQLKTAVFRHWCLIRAVLLSAVLIPPLPALTTLDNMAQIGPILFVLHCPRWPGQVGVT